MAATVSVISVMTEITDNVVKLEPAVQRLILHWGEMGTRWGINRTVAQIHSLLYLSPEPLHADQIAATLQVARSNVSTSLRELQRWGIVKVVHVMGDRRDHFETLSDVWELFQIILDHRKKREIDPTVEMLRECAKELKASKGKTDFQYKRVSELQDFFEMMTSWYNQMRGLPRDSLAGLFRLGAKVQQILDLRGGKGRG